MTLKPTFLNQQNPILCAITENGEPSSIISDMCNAFDDGAEAFAIELDHMKDEDKTEAKLREIFSVAGSRPVYVTNYRQNNNLGKSDEQLARELLVALDAGASLIDVMGDMFDPQKLELTENPEAEEKQIRLIKEIHARGGEVLMSSHTKCFMKEEDVIRFASIHEKRGADIAKIVTWADTEDELVDNLRTSVHLKKALSIPFLFLSCGRCSRIQRVGGYMFGSSIVLGVTSHNNENSRLQPSVRAMKAVLSNANWQCDRDL